MICFNCGSDVGEEERCPYCGANLRVYRRILYASVAAYNEGLERARMRDLTGALESLHKSLRFDKYNTTARNLLGLVYYEMGQSALALREWVVSKNFQPKNNPVDNYLDEVQKPGLLNRMDQMTQKFNQSLAYCKNQSTDLAKIQLKRILRSNPKMIEAYQLLALVLMREGKYEDARRNLLAAAKIDVKNPITMAYLEETRSKARPRRRNKRRTAPATDRSAALEREAALPLPRSGFFEILDSNGSGLINILVGGVLGILVAIFLIVPTIRQNENNDTRNALVSANKEAANTANTVAGLKKQVKELKQELKQYTGKGDLKTSYEKLLEAEAAKEDDDIETAGEAISIVNVELLDPIGKERFEAVSTAIGEELAEDAYEDGSAAFRARRYEDAINSLLSVVEFDPEYNTGAALYYLAQAYEYTDNEAGAARYYAQYAELYPNTSRGNTAKSKAEEFGQNLSEESEEEGEDEDAGTGTTQGARPAAVSGNGTRPNTQNNSNTTDNGNTTNSTTNDGGTNTGNTTGGTTNSDNTTSGTTTNNGGTATGNTTGGTTANTGNTTGDAGTAEPTQNTGAAEAAQTDTGAQTTEPVIESPAATQPVEEASEGLGMAVDENGNATP